MEGSEWREGNIQRKGETNTQLRAPDPWTEPCF